MDSDRNDAMGARVYARLSVGEKEALMGFLETSIAKADLDSSSANKKRKNSDATADDGSEGNTKWVAAVKAKINTIIQRRQEEGDSLDASDVVDEVLPAAIALIPDEVRRELFLKLREMLVAQSKQC